MNKTEAMDLARETGCGIKMSMLTLEPYVYFYCQEAMNFKKLSVLAFCDFDMGVLPDREWMSVRRPECASKFTSPVGKTLVLDSVEISIGCEVIADINAFIDRRNDVFDSMTYAFNGVLSEIDFKTKSPHSPFKLDDMENILPKNFNLCDVHEYHEKLRSGGSLYVVGMPKKVNFNGKAKRTAWDDVEIYFPKVEASFSNFLHFDMRDLKMKKEEKMKKVILKDEMGREFGFDSKDDAEKHIQENGGVREEFVMYKKVGTFRVPAPKLEKVGK